MYNLRSNLKKMAVIGGTGLAGIVAGESMDNESIQTISAYVLAGSVAGALIVGFRGMIDTERPYFQNRGGDNRGTPRQGYSNQRKEQKIQQKLDRDRAIRDELYYRNLNTARERINRDGFGGFLWRRYYSIKDKF